MEKELSLVFFPYDIIEIHLDKAIGVFLTKLEESIYLDIGAINSKGDITSYGPYKRSSRIAGVYFYNRKSILRFTNYGNESASLSIIFAKDDEFPDSVYINDPREYPAYHSNDYAVLGKPIIYDFIRNYNGLTNMMIFCLSATFILFLFIIYSCCCCCCDCC